MRSRKKNALYLLPRLVGTCAISYQEKREGNKKNRVKTNTFVSILVPYSQPLSENTVLLLAAYCRNSTTGEISNWKLWYLVVSEYLCMAGRGDIMVRGTRSQRVPYTHSR
jgi:hypothetical protein